ncbi:MAG: hypothetical protein QOG54_2523 [Actinomycetota bacterium]|jgi:hypothetical protein|nr:hypothetical protein [Actinomycetota bacterium]
MLSLLRVLTTTSGFLRSAGASGLGGLDGVCYLLRCRLIDLSGPQEKLEQDRTFELFEGVCDLVAGAARRLPLGDDAFRMRHADPQWGRADLALPDDVARLHSSPYSSVPRN